MTTDSMGLVLSCCWLRVERVPLADASQVTIHAAAGWAKSCLVLACGHDGEGVCACVNLPGGKQLALMCLQGLHSGACWCAHGVDDSNAFQLLLALYFRACPALRQQLSGISDGGVPDSKLVDDEPAGA